MPLARPTPGFQQPIPGHVLPLMGALPQAKDGANDPLAMWLAFDRPSGYLLRKNTTLIALVAGLAIFWAFGFALLPAHLQETVNAVIFLLIPMAVVAHMLVTKRRRKGRGPSLRPYTRFRSFRHLVMIGAPQEWREWALLPLTPERATSIVAWEVLSQKSNGPTIVGAFCVFLSLLTLPAILMPLPYGPQSPVPYLVGGVAFAILMGLSYWMARRMTPCVGLMEFRGGMTEELNLLLRRIRQHPAFVGTEAFFYKRPIPSWGCLLFLIICAVYLLPPVFLMLKLFPVFVILVVADWVALWAAGRYMAQNLFPGEQEKAQRLLAEYTYAWQIGWPILSGPLPEQKE
ncbi:MAG: hypothetical protein RLY93_17095 [Sumerlaeia bacterium]